MQFPKQTRPVTTTLPCFLSTWPVCMPGICHSSAPQCSGHRRGKPCRSKFTKCSDGFSQKKKLKNGGRFQWPGSCRDRQKMICPSHPGSACKVDMIHPGNALWFSGVPICFWTQDTTVLIVLIAHNPVAHNQRS